MPGVGIHLDVVADTGAFERPGERHRGAGERPVEGAVRRHDRTAPRAAASRRLGSRPYCTALAPKPRLAMSSANATARQNPAIPTFPLPASWPASH